MTDYETLRKDIRNLLNLANRVYYAESNLKITMAARNVVTAVLQLSLEADANQLALELALTKTSGLKKKAKKSKK